MIELLVAQEQGIASAQEDVADGRGAPDIIDLFVVLWMEIIATGIAHQARASAVSAVSRTSVRHQKEHPIRIAMHQAGHRRVAILTARIAHLPGSGVSLLDSRDNLPSDWAILICGMDQVEKVRGDGQS